MYVVLLIIVSFFGGYGIGVASVLISRKANDRRKIKKKYSFGQVINKQRLSSDVSKYKHDKEEHSAKNF